VVSFFLLLSLSSPNLSRHRLDVCHRTTSSGYVFATKARIDNLKKFLSSTISSTCPHNMVNFSVLAAEIVSLVWGTPANFNGFVSWLRYCSDVAEWKPTKLCSVWPVPGLVDYVYIFGGCCAVTEFCQVQNSLCVLHLRSPIGSVIARQSNSGREPNFVALSAGRNLYSAGRPSSWALARILVMAALRSRCGHYIFALWFLLYGRPM